MANHLISTNQHLLNLYDAVRDVQQQLNTMSGHIDELRNQENRIQRRAAPTSNYESIIDSIIGRTSGSRMPTLSRDLFEFTMPIPTERGVSMNTLNNATEIINFEALEEPTLCSICRDTISSNSVCRKIKNCNHLFHIVCIDQWLERSVKCPLCRGLVSTGTGTGTRVTPSSTL